MNAHITIDETMTSHANEIMTGAYIDTKTNKETLFTFKTNINVKDKIQFVSDVTALMVSENYFSFLKDLIFDFEIINVFTDIDVSEILNAADAIGEIENIVINTKIVEIVKSNVDNAILDELKIAVNSNIEYKTGVHNNIIEDSIVQLLSSIKSKIDSIDTETVLQMAETLSTLGNNVTSEGIVNAYANSPAFLESLKEREKRIDTMIKNKDNIKDKK